MTNIFKNVKQNITTRQAAEYYGFDVRHNGMICCPFHDDKNPSMKVDTRYHCFGCGEDGDVIDFVRNLFDISLYDAAQKLASDFNISDSDIRVQPVKKSSLPFKTACMSHEYGYRLLCDYRNKLLSWKEQFKPETEDEELNPLFVESVQNIDYVNYLIDRICLGTEYEKDEACQEIINHNFH